MTTLYLALLATRTMAVLPSGNAADVRWVTIAGYRVKERLAFDHADLLKAALERLRSKVEYTSLPAFLLPEEFTLSELQRVYEVVLGRRLEKKAFRTRMLAVELLVETSRMRAGANRPAQLYRLTHRRIDIGGRRQRILDENRRAVRVLAIAALHQINAIVFVQ